MNANHNGHTAEFLKRQAKKLKKGLGITYHEALDKAAIAAGLANWGHFCNSPHARRFPVTIARPNIAHGADLPRGTLVRLKQDRKRVGLVYECSGGTVSFYHDWGPITATREEVAVCRDQSPAAIFRPLRLNLPYGKWRCRDGMEVLFNREYCPIWAKNSNGTVDSIEPKTWVDWVDQDHYYNDGCAPMYDKRTRTKCLAILKSWGVEDRINGAVALVPVAIRSGNVRILKGRSEVSGHFLDFSEGPISSI